jgi:hypothetical protein
MPDKHFIQDVALGALIGHEIDKKHQETVAAVRQAGQAGQTDHQKTDAEKQAEFNKVWNPPVQKTDPEGRAELDKSFEAELDATATLTPQQVAAGWLMGVEALHAPTGSPIKVKSYIDSVCDRTVITGSVGTFINYHDKTTGKKTFTWIPGSINRKALKSLAKGMIPLTPNSGIY